MQMLKYYFLAAEDSEGFVKIFHETGASCK